MSDHRALAAVTVTLQKLLGSAIKSAGLSGVDVQTGPPRALPEQEVRNGRVNIFLYNVAPNPTFRNSELPYRLADGTLIQQPRLALDLNFLITFFGDDRRQLPNRLLGIAASALHDDAYPAREHFPKGDEGSINLPPLEGSGLDHQRHALRFIPQILGTEELSKIWGLFAHIPYVLSSAYIASVVILESSLSPQAQLEVRDAQVFFPGPRPELQRIEPQSLSFRSGAMLQVTGSHLASQQVKILVGDSETPATDIRPTSLQFTLPADIEAGVNLVQVVHGSQRTTGGSVHWDLESNALALVVRPVVRQVEFLPLPTTDDTADAERMIVQVKFAPPVHARTSILLLLYRSDGAAGRQGYRLQGWANPPSGDSVRVETALESGRYRVRLQMGGVTSDLPPRATDGRSSTSNLELEIP